MAAAQDFRGAAQEAQDNPAGIVDSFRQLLGVPSQPVTPVLAASCTHSGQVCPKGAQEEVPENPLGIPSALQAGCHSLQDPAHCWAQALEVLLQTLEWVVVVHHKAQDSAHAHTERRREPYEAEAETCTSQGAHAEEETRQSPGPHLHRLRQSTRADAAARHMVR